MQVANDSSSELDENGLDASQREQIRDAHMTNPDERTELQWCFIKGTIRPARRRAPIQ